MKRKRTSRKRKGKRKPIVISVKGDLSSLGYKMKNKISTRMKALREAVKKYGYANVVRKLVALYVLNKNRNPRFARMVKRDLERLRKAHERAVAR